MEGINSLNPNFVYVRFRKVCKVADLINLLRCDMTQEYIAQIRHLEELKFKCKKISRLGEIFYAVFKLWYSFSFT